MPAIIFIAIMGAAAGFLTWRVIPVRTNLPITMAVGALGAVLSWMAFRFLLLLTGWLIWSMAALIGALVLILLLQRVWPGR